MRDIQHHRHRGEVTHHRGHVDHALLAELLHRPLIACVADAAVAQQFVAEVVGDFLVARHAGRAPSVGERIRRFRLDACLERQRMMNRPLELLRPPARRDQHHELADARFEGVLETQILTHLLQPVHQLRAAQQRNERPEDAAARAARQFVGGAALRLVHLLRCKRRHAIAHNLAHGGRSCGNQNAQSESQVEADFSSITAVTASSTPAATSAARKSPATLTTMLATIGPAIWPAANAEVIAAISSAADGPATRRASCIPTMVITMNVPPTNSAASVMAASPDAAAGNATPSAMTMWPGDQTRPLPKRRASDPAASVGTNAPVTNIGQDQPNSRGYSNCCHSRSGRKI